MMEYRVIRLPDTGGDELQHHGIKGQKWGIRRYQNDDGTLTPAGKARYAEAKEIVSKGSITGSKMIKNAGRRGLIGAGIGAGIAGGGTYDAGTWVTNHTSVGVAGMDLGSKVSKYFMPGKGLSLQNTAIGFAAGFAGTAVGSLIKDTIHNQRVKNAEKFIREFGKTYGGQK